ncbi:MAG: esterase/lipase family protein [Maricaulaceae bacterium]
MMSRSGLGLALSALVLSGCLNARPAQPDLRILYNETAQYHLPDRNPVVVIPGVLGSRLRDAATGQVVWGAFEPASANPNDPDGLRALALPIAPDQPLTELTDTVRPDGVLDRVRLKVLGLPIQLQAYAGILSTLGAGGYRDQQLGLSGVDYGSDHFTCFQFDYDWRRDNTENAARLKTFLDERRRFVSGKYREEFGLQVPPETIKFDIVAHSMGGLILRYFLRYGDQPITPERAPTLDWAGASYVERAILVGTPNAGSAASMLKLINGQTDGRPILPRYPPALLGTYPSLYQLLPRTRHGVLVSEGDTDRRIDILDPALWAQQGWGLADPNQDGVIAALLPQMADPQARRRQALAHQARLLAQAGAVFAALDRPATPPKGLEFFAVAGDAAPTPKTLSVDGATGAVTVSDDAPGDGTVLRSSVLLDERVGGPFEPRLKSPIGWRSQLLLFSDHLGLTKDPAFSDNVLYWLLEDPRGEAFTPVRPEPKTHFSD